MSKMAVQEFNEKYKDFIEPRFEDQGLMIDSAKTIDFLDLIFSKVLVHIPGFQYSQIKMKFGSSRFYADNVPTPMMYWIEGQINKSCENGE